MSNQFQGYGGNDKVASGRPSSELDLYGDAVDPSEVDGLFERVNLGMGNYSGKEQWQQIDRYRHFIFADAAFSRKLKARAIYETKRELARQGWTYYSDVTGNSIDFKGWVDQTESFRKGKNRRQWLAENSEKRWKQLDDEMKTAAIEHFAGDGAMEWTPAHGRMMAVHHETSRSKDARLIDNLFGRIKKMISEEKTEKSGGLLGGK